MGLGWGGWDWDLGQCEELEWSKGGFKIADSSVDSMPDSISHDPPQPNNDRITNERETNERETNERNHFAPTLPHPTLPPLIRQPA